MEALSKEELAERLVKLSEAKYTLQNEFTWLQNRHNNMILGLPPDKSPTSFHEKVNKYVSKEKEKEKEVKEKKKEDKEKEKDTTEARAQDPKLEEEIRGGREDEERRKKRKRE